MTRREFLHGSPVIMALCLLFVLCVALAAAALYPQSDGAVIYQDKGTTVDASHSDQGYVMVKHEPSQKKLKMRISLGSNTYTYDLNANNQYDTFPLTFGTGKYKLQVFRQVSGNRYANDSSLSFSVEIQDETLPFLYPNQYVSYTADSAAVAKATELCAELESPEKRLNAIRKFVTKTIFYDFVRAATVKSGYIPVIDDVLAQGKGICFDYAALTACMLRAQGIPAKLVIGYADRIYHAWNNVFVNGEWLMVDTTADANNMKIKKYTEERIY